VSNTNSWVEVIDTGYTTNNPDAVFLADSVQTRDAANADVAVPAVGYIKGQVEIVGLTRLNANFHDALTELQISGFDYIPTTPGI